MTRRLLALLLFSVLLLSCGRKDNPKPPEDFAPNPVRLLSAAGEVNAVTINWIAPTTTAKGDRLIDLMGFHVKRRMLEKDANEDFETINKIKIEQPAPTEPGTAAATNPPLPGVDVTTGISTPPMLKFNYRDEDVKPGQRYEYVVVPVNEDGTEGAVASIVRVTFIGTSSVVETLGTQIVTTL